VSIVLLVRFQTETIFYQENIASGKAAYLKKYVPAMSGWLNSFVFNQYCSVFL
jgi:hypothetical protein